MKVFFLGVLGSLLLIAPISLHAQTSSAQMEQCYQERGAEHVQQIISDASAYVREVLASYDRQVVYRLQSSTNKKRIPLVRQSLAAARSRLLLSAKAAADRQVRLSVAASTEGASMDLEDTTITDRYLVSERDFARDTTAMVDSAFAQLQRFASARDRVIIRRVLSEDEGRIRQKYHEMFFRSFQEFLAKTTDCAELAATEYEDSENEMDEGADAADLARMAAPSPNDFRVTVHGSDRLNKMVNASDCRTEMEYAATVASKDVIDIEYRWEFSDGHISPVRRTRVATFVKNPGGATGSYQSVVLYKRAYEGHQLGAARLVIVSPFSMTSHPSPYSVYCSSQPAKSSLGSVTASIFSDANQHIVAQKEHCSQLMRVNANLHIKGSVHEIEYHWRKMNGVTTPSQKVRIHPVPKKDGETLMNVSTDISINEASFGAVQLVVTKPVLAVSAPHHFSLQCEEEESPASSEQQTRVPTVMRAYIRGSMEHQKVVGMPCSETIRFAGVITSTQRSRARYKWLFADGTDSGVQEVSLNRLDDSGNYSGEVSHDRLFTQSHFGSVRLVIVDSDTASEPQGYSLVCRSSSSTGGAAGAAPGQLLTVDAPRIEGMNASLAGAYGICANQAYALTARAQVSGSINRLRYHLEFADGTRTAEQTLDLGPVQSDSIVSTPQLRFTSQMLPARLGAVRVVVTAPYSVYSSVTPLSGACTQ